MKIISLLCASLILSACACGCGEKPMANMSHQAAKTYTGDCITAKVEGMTCESCAMVISENLKKQPGVEGVDVDVAKGVAHIHMAKGKTLSSKTIAKIITRSDYTFKGVANGC